MPPPPVAMAASKIKIRDLEEQLQQKNKIIRALEAQRRSHLASVAEKEKYREFAKMNKGWRKHNALPHTPRLYRSEATTNDEDGNIKTEKVIFVTEYRFAMERVKEVKAEAELEETRAKELRAEQKDVYRKTQELMKVAEELKVKVGRKRWMRIAKASPKEDQDTPTTDRNTTDSDDVNMGVVSTPTTSKHARLLLHPPKQEESLSKEEIHPTRLRLSRPKRERSASVEEIHPARLRLSQPKRERSKSVEEIEEKVEESSVRGEAFRPTRLRLSKPRGERVGEDSHRVRSGRILKASAKAKK